MFRADERGQGLLEITVAGGILVSVLGLVVFLSTTALRNLVDSQVREQATFLAQQGIEGVRNFKDRNWGFVEGTDPITNCPPHDTCLYGLSNKGQEPYLDYGSDAWSGCTLAMGFASDDCRGRFFAIKEEAVLCLADSGGASRLTPAASCTVSAYVSDSASFRRKIIIEPATPHPSWVKPNNLVACADYSCNLRRVTVIVSWDGSLNPSCSLLGRAKCVKIVAYLAKWKESPVTPT